MKKILKIIAVVLAAAFIAVQFYRPDRTTPPVIEAETLEAETQASENVKAILARSCNDCHSNRTVYPWYSQITPFSWLLANHINEGRAELNFSVWATYADERKRRKLEDICEQVTNGEMPYKQYLWIHRDATLTEADKQILCDWTRAEIGKIARKLSKPESK